MSLSRVIWLAALWPLAGCLGEAGLGNATQSRPANSAATELPLYDGEVVVRGPRGYCVDASSLRRQPSNRLVLMGSCETLSGQIGVSVDPALIVVNVGARKPGREQPSAAVIAAGVAPKTPIEMIDGDGIALVHLDAGGALALPGGDPRYWRAGLVINDHLVSLAIYAPMGSRLAGSAGKALIVDLAENLRDASPVRSYAPAAQTPSNTQAPQAADADPTPQKPKRKKSGLLSVLFPKSG